MMMQYGLIGRSLKHSFSPQFFSEKFEKEGIAKAHNYKLFPLEHIEQIQELWTIPNLRGLNVTIPYKEAVLPFLDRLDPIAAEIGAVNTIAFRSGEKWGFNTDIVGFEKSLMAFLDSSSIDVEALILGTGGASKAVQYTLKRMRIPFKLVSRTASENCLSYEALNKEIISPHLLIINTTPLGTYPEINTSPKIPYEFLTESHYTYDLIYNPKWTKFLKLAKARGAKTCNGYEMLRLQALEAWSIWNAHDIL